MARIFADENFPLPTVERLRELGHDVVTVQDVGGGEQGWSDPQVLRHALRDGRAVLTLNRKDFIRLHRQNPEHDGVVVCTVDPDFKSHADRIHQTLEKASDLAGKLVRVNRPRS